MSDGGVHTRLPRMLLRTVAGYAAYGVCESVHLQACHAMTAGAALNKAVQTMHVIKPDWRLEAGGGQAMGAKIVLCMLQRWLVILQPCFHQAEIL